ncbi:MAG: hypothetical protein JW982_15920 [Spirochaetes bacterium]|nr:hypothetical protein [Spirochaetota bacterium]
MKKLIFTAILAVFLMPASVFALVNAEVYGGYSFAGEISDTDIDSVKGLGYGFRAHYYDEILILGYGIGGFAQYTPLKGEITILNNTEDVEFNKTVYGFDGFLTLNVPLLPLHPYVRGGFSIYDKTQIVYPSVDDTNVEYFSSYYGGVGLSLGILPLPVLSVQIFAEYIYEYSALQDSSEFTGHKVNIGALIRI